MFRRPSNLSHHDAVRQLYIDIDVSKEFGFGTMLYHRSDGDAVGPKGAKPILFLSKMLTDTERNYWSTEDR